MQDVFTITAITLYKGRIDRVDTTIFNNPIEAIEEYTTLFERFFGEEYPDSDEHILQSLRGNEQVIFATSTRDGFDTAYILESNYVK